MVSSMKSRGAQKSQSGSLKLIYKPALHTDNGLYDLLPEVGAELKRAALATVSNTVRD
jgi:hypothetical protein